MRVKSLAVSPGIKFPCLSLTTTVSTTSCDFDGEGIGPEAVAEVFWPICCAACRTNSGEGQKQQSEAGFSSQNLRRSEFAGCALR